MKIGIIGSGIVGRVLATAFIKEGHQVMLGTRNTSKEEVVKWLNENTSGSIGTFEDTAKFGDLLVLSTAGDATENAIQMAGIKNFDNKIVIDTTNPISHLKAPVNGVLQYFTTADKSLHEILQDILPKARLVKAFNSVGNYFMYKPSFSQGTPTMFICGNDEEAKNIVSEILYVFGWDVEDMGKAESARAIEPLCILWCIPGFLRNEWTHAFKLLKK
jgi:8-hydroxy-5-deazaflavin:NADPH oxidoreductase